MATLQRGLLGVLVTLVCAVSPFVTADTDEPSVSVTAAPQATQPLRPGDQLRAQARRSLFVEFPELYPAIQRGGAFGGSWSNAIATDIFARSEQGIADAKRLSTITEVASRTWLIN
ncbi:MAG: MBL fold metallo-hydrolase, partial [Luminiphilus sp.]|nr:MBL fold metallo-hydrolase [Luminiphilus sp.]